MKYSKLNSVYEEWIKSVEAKETDRTFCAVDVDIQEEGPNIKQENDNLNAFFHGFCCNFEMECLYLRQINN